MALSTKIHNYFCFVPSLIPLMICGVFLTYQLVVWSKDTGGPGTDTKSQNILSMEGWISDITQWLFFYPIHSFPSGYKVYFKVLTSNVGPDQRKSQGVAQGAETYCPGVANLKSFSPSCFFTPPSLILQWLPDVYLSICLLCGVRARGGPWCATVASRRGGQSALLQVCKSGLAAPPKHGVPASFLPCPPHAHPGGLISLKSMGMGDGGRMLWRQGGVEESGGGSRDANVGSWWRWRHRTRLPPTINNLEALCCFPSSASPPSLTPSHALAAHHTHSPSGTNW